MEEGKQLLVAEMEAVGEIVVLGRPSTSPYLAILEKIFFSSFQTCSGRDV